MTARRRFVYADFIREWRALAGQYGLNAKTGAPIERECVYRTDAAGRRRLDYVPVQPDREPLRLCEPSNPRWWTLPELWHDSGPAASVVERDAIASIAQQARAAHGLAEPRTLADVVQDAWREDGASRSRQLVMPLRELHAKRGLTIETIAGMRLEVAIKLPA